MKMVDLILANGEKITKFTKITHYTILALPFALALQYILTTPSVPNTFPQDL